jgi:hypothetical protein
MGWICGTYRGETRCIVISWGNLRQRGHLEDLGLDGWVILKWIPRKLFGMEWTGVIWLRIRTDGEHL